MCMCVGGCAWEKDVEMCNCKQPLQVAKPFGITAEAPRYLDVWQNSGLF